MIDKENYLSVPEFAKQAGIAKQGIYEQAKNENSKLFPYLVFIGKKIYVSKDALKEYEDKIKQIVKDEQEKTSEKQDTVKEEKQEEKTGKEEEKEGQAKDGQGEDKENQDLTQQYINDLREDKRRLGEVIDELQKQNEDLRRMLAYEQQAHNETQRQLEDLRSKRNKQIELTGEENYIEVNQEEQAEDQSQQEKKEEENLNIFQRIARWFIT